jgi:glycosyltransferase involved in cell wall biosynthesis
MTSRPAVTVGLPVYDGENYVAAAIESYLSQTLENFELVISDNASTDGTEGICREYARADRRIRYIRQARNIGASPNANFLVHQARAPLFKWAGHDDIVKPPLLERCAEVLDANPTIVLCHADMGFIDEHDNVLGYYRYTLPTSSPRAPVRFDALLHADGGDDEYGVIRLDVLRRVQPMNSFYNAGRPFVAEIALHGRFHQVPEPLFFRREHQERGDRIGKVTDLCANLDPARAGQSSVRLKAEYVRAYFRAIARAPLSSADRRQCHRLLLAWLAGHARPSGQPSPTGLPAGTEPEYVPHTIAPSISVRSA